MPEGLGSKEVVGTKSDYLYRGKIRAAIPCLANVGKRKLCWRATGLGLGTNI